VKVFGFYSECGRKASEGFESDVIWCNLYFKIISFLAAKWRLMVNCISEQRPDFKLHYSAKAIIIIKKSMVLSQKEIWRLVEQYIRDRYESTQKHTWFFIKGQNIWWRKGSLFNKCCCENWISACRKLKLHSCLSPSINIHSK
jgi:hypothetical protein